MERLEEIKKIKQILEDEITRYSDAWLITRDDDDFEMLRSLCNLVTNYNKRIKEIIEKEYK